MARAVPPSITDAQLEAFAAVVEQGSFTGAARQLGMSQSAVSHAVAALEETLRVSLLDRSARGVRLTSIGERIMHHAREVLRLKALMWQDAEANRRVRAGVVRVGSFGPTSSRHLLPPILESLAARHPDVTVQIMEGSDQEVEQWIRGSVVDVGFVNLPNEEFDTFDLAEDEMVAILPTRHPLAARPRIAPRELASLPFILSTGGCEPVVQAILHEFRLDVRYQIRDVQTILALIAEGSGLSVKPVLSLPDPLPPGVTCRPLDPPVPRRVGLAVQDRRKLSPLTRAFLGVAALQRVPA